jgi:hypothetical protein
MVLLQYHSRNWEKYLEKMSCGIPEKSKLTQEEDSSLIPPFFPSEPLLYMEGS